MSEKSLSHETNNNSNNTAIYNHKDQIRANDDSNQCYLEKKPRFLITTSKGIKIISNLNPNAPEFYPVARQKPAIRECENQRSSAELILETIVKNCPEKLPSPPTTPTTTTITTTNSKSTSGESLFSPTSLSKPQVSVTSIEKTYSNGGKGKPDEETLLSVKKNANVSSITICCHDIFDNIVVENAETIERAMGIRKVDEILKVSNIDENADKTTEDISEEIPDRNVINKNINLNRNLIENETNLPDASVLVGLPFSKYEVNAPNKSPNLETTCADINNDNKVAVPIEKIENIKSSPKSLNEVKELFVKAIKKKNECVGDTDQKIHILSNDNVDLKSEFEKIEKEVDKSNLASLESSKLAEAANSLKEYPLNTTAGKQTSTIPSPTSIINRLKTSRISRPITTNESGACTARASTRTITTPRMLGATLPKKINTKTVNTTALLTNATTATSRTIIGNQKRPVATNANVNSKSLSGIQNKELAKSSATGASRSLLSARARTTATLNTIKKPTNVIGNASSSSSATSNISTNSTKTNDAITSRGTTGITSKIGSVLSTGSKKITDAIPRLVTSRIASSRQATHHYNSPNPSASSSKEKLNNAVTSR